MSIIQAESGTDFLTEQAYKPAEKQNKVQRITPDKDLATKAIEYTIDFVSTQLRERLDDSKRADAEINAFLQPSRELLKKSKEEQGRVDALRNLQKSALEKRTRRSHLGLEGSEKLIHRQPRSMAVEAGVNVLTPPWQSFFWPNPPNFPFEFANGNVFSDTGIIVATRDSYAGEVTGDGGSGTASAGVGTFVSSPVDTVVSIRPFMPYDYNWDDDSVAGWTAHTSGGVGAMVYEAGAPTPFIDIRPQLWDDGTSWSHDGDAQSGFLEDHLQNNELAFSMRAGQAYLVWFWIWGHADCSGVTFNPIFGSPWGSVSAFRMTANLNFMVVQS